MLWNWECWECSLWQLANFEFYLRTFRHSDGQTNMVSAWVRLIYWQLQASTLTPSVCHYIILIICQSYCHMIYSFRAHGFGLNFLTIFLLSPSESRYVSSPPVPHLSPIFTFNSSEFYLSLSFSIDVCFSAAQPFSWSSQQNSDRTDWSNFDIQPKNVCFELMN